MSHPLEEAWMGSNIQKWSEPQLTTAMDALAVPPSVFPTTPGSCLHQLDSMLLAFSEGMDQPMGLEAADSFSHTQEDAYMARAQLPPLVLQTGTKHADGPWANPGSSDQDMLSLWEAAPLGQKSFLMPALPSLPPPAECCAPKHETLLVPSASSASTHIQASLEAPAFSMQLRTAAASPARLGEQTPEAEQDAAQLASRSTGGKSDSSGGRTPGKGRTSPGGGTSRGRASPGDAKADKVAAARARNARNQQLHRQRQRDRIESCEALCRDLRSKIALLAVENAGLRATNQVLEVSEQQRLQRALTAASHVARASAAAASELAWDTGSTSDDPMTAETCEKLAALFSCISEGAGGTAVTVEEVGRMSAEAVFLRRQAYGPALEALFRAGAADAKNPAHAELLRLILLWGKCEEHLWGEHPQLVHRFFAMAHELEAQACTLPSLLKWQRILERLGLREDQRGALKEAHERLVDQLLNITSERFHVSATLQETCPRGGKHWKGSSTYLSLLGAQRRLAASIRAEHELMRQANLTFRQVVAPLQQGLCDMLAHPGAPDIIAIFNLLSAGL